MRIKLLHLALLLGCTMVLASVGGVMATYWVIEDEIQDLLGDDLEAHAALLAHSLGDAAGSGDNATLEARLRRLFEEDKEETLWVSVFDPLTGRRHSNLDLPPPDLVPGSGIPVVADSGGHRWFGYQQRAADGVVVQLLHRSDRYQEVREEVIEGVIGPALAVSAVNVALLALLIYLSLWPVTRMARQIEQRAADSLAPLAVETPTRELQVLRDALNGLIRDVDGVLSREREFASDVAHELRTPLTTLQLELASESPDLLSLRSEVQRVSKLVVQLLTLARLRRAQWRESFVPMSLDTCCQRELENLEPAFLEANVTIKAALSPVIVLGDETLLAALVANLLRNVLSHCPAGCIVTVTTSSEGSVAALRVVDNGPGISPERRQRLTEGAARMDRREQGLGLGLMICRKIVDVHGGQLSLGSRADARAGLQVVVELPLAAP